MIDNIIRVFEEVDIIARTFETLGMTFISGLIAYLFGIPIAVLMVITEKEGIIPNKFINKLTSIIVNLGRSIPFLILLVALIPLTKIVMGTSIGLRGMIFPLSVAAIPFTARIVEQTLKEVPQGVIDAAKCMGCTNMQIIFKVYLKESIPQIIKGVSITLITLIGYSAMSGTVGCGGLGDTAVQYGYYNFDTTTMVIMIIIIILIVQFIQSLFDFISRKVDRKLR